jgi:hypothetical protein
MGPVPAGDRALLRRATLTAPGVLQDAAESVPPRIPARTTGTSDGGTVGAGLTAPPGLR